MTFANSPIFTSISGPILFTADFAHMNYLKTNRTEVVRYIKSMIEGTRWLYDPKNKEEALAINMKVLKSTRESPRKITNISFRSSNPFPKDGTVSKAVLRQNHGSAG